MKNKYLHKHKILKNKEEKHRKRCEYLLSLINIGDVYFVWLNDKQRYKKFRVRKIGNNYIEGEMRYINNAGIKFFCNEKGEFIQHRNIIQLHYSPICDTFVNCNKQMGVNIDYLIKSDKIYQEYIKNCTIQLPPEMKLECFTYLQDYTLRTHGLVCYGKELNEGCNFKPFYIPLKQLWNSDKDTLDLLYGHLNLCNVDDNFISQVINIGYKEWRKLKFNGDYEPARFKLED